MTYRFDDFELDVARAELRRDGAPVAIEPQVFELLKLLASSGDRVVTRDEIFEAIWGNRIVSDAALSGRIRDARKALGDDGSTQKFIRTVQRRGLRFMAAVEEISPQPAAPAQPEQGVAPQDHGMSEDILARPAIAVVPFTCIGGDAADEVLADGLTDEVVAALSAWRYFPVISRNVTLRSRGVSPGAEDIVARTGARYVLSGTFRRLGGKIKVTVALTDTQFDEQIWSSRVQRDVADLVELEEEIAAQVVTLVVPEVGGAEARRVLRRPASDLTAWELAMRASWLIEQGTEADFVTAEQLAAEAIARAPDWTLPHTLIAIAKFQQAMMGFSGADSSTAFTETLEAAKKALEIDRGSWIAHALTAVGELWTNRNHERAFLHVTRAIELNPSASMNYHFGGCITGFGGDPAQARDYQKRLFRLDPLYPYAAVIEADLGLWHMLDAEFPEATDRLDRAHQWDPRYGRALQRQISLAGLNDDRERAMAAARKLSDLGMPLDHDVIAASYPFKNPDHAEMFLDGLRRSGVNY